MKEDSPWQIGNYPGEEKAKVLSPEVAGRLIKRAKRPLLICGSLISKEVNGKKLIDYAIDIISSTGMPVVATAHTKRFFLERGVKPDSSLPLVNIVDLLRDPLWKGVRGEGQHDLVLFFGILYYIGSQGLSTLKHFAPHLRTLTLCRFFHPNADFSFPNLDDSKWIDYLDSLLKNIKGGDYIVA
jgi:acetyl-CoA decarbonylase/synthase complex subunit epsilon